MLIAVFGVGFCVGVVEVAVAVGLVAFVDDGACWCDVVFSVVCVCLVVVVGVCAVFAVAVVVVVVVVVNVRAVSPVEVILVWLSL